MTGIFAELVRLQDDYAEKSRAANGKPPGSMEAVALDACLVAYDDFKRKASRDFRTMMGIAAREGRGALEEITSMVVAELADRLDFDAVSAQAHHAKVKAAEVRMELENLKREVKEMRKFIP